MLLPWKKLHPKASPEHLGLIPSFFSLSDPAPAREQIARNYAHGGGWFPISGFKAGEGGSLRYPGDPALVPLYEAQLREETIRVYLSAWVAIFQPDGSFEISRID